MMVSINGLPSAGIPRSNRASKAKKKSVSDAQASSSSSQVTSLGQTTKVATAVAHSIHHMSDADMHDANLQYDLPEGRGRKAMEEYLDVMNQARREELAQMLGVDIYI
jgi:hypothetical protein